MQKEHSDVTLRIREVTKATDGRRGKGKQVYDKHRKELNSIVTSFLKAMPKDGSVEEYTMQYQIHNNRWREHCRNMCSRYPWFVANPDQFEKSVQLMQKRILRDKAPLKFLWVFYIKPLWWVPVLSAAIYAITEFVLPLIKAAL